MSININNFQELQELIENAQNEDKWSVHAFVGVITAVSGPLYNIKPNDLKLPDMAGVKCLGGLDFTNLIVGQSVVACFDADGQAWLMGPVLDTIDSDYVPLGTALVTFLNTFVNIFLTHLHLATAQGSPTSSPIDATQTPITSLQLSVPANLLSTTTKVKI